MERAGGDSGEFRLKFAFYSLTIKAEVRRNPMALTRRQKELYDFLLNFVDQHGYSPSFEEIAEGMGLSSLATVHKHITNLEQKGLLKRDYNRSRSIDLLKPRGLMKHVAGGGCRCDGAKQFHPAAAGAHRRGPPLEAVENPESISLADFTRSKEVFVLQVKGESMQDEHIVNGDYVLVEKTNTARDGEIVVALVDGSEATLKRIYVEGSKVRLQPSNADHAADHGSGGVGAGAGKGDWGTTKILKQSAVSSQQSAVSINISSPTMWEGRILRCGT